MSNLIDLPEGAAVSAAEPARRSGAVYGRGAARLWVLVIVAVAAVAVVPLARAESTSSVSPQPGVVSGIVDALVAAVRALRLVAPYVTGVGLLTFAAYGLAGTWSARAHALDRLSLKDFTGIDQFRPIDPTRFQAVVLHVRRYFSGCGIAMLAILLIGSTSGIENEVTNGPLRPIEAMEHLLANGEPVTFVLQSPKITFMDDSVLPAGKVAELRRTAPFTVIPFGRHLFNIDEKSALEMSIPDARYALLTGRPASTSCSEASIVVDDTVGVRPGQNVEVNGIALRVAKVLSGIAQMNRSIAVVADSTVRRCIEAGTDTSYFGAIAETGNAAAVRQLLDSHNSTELAAVPSAAFAENNRAFWRANATPLLLQIILYLTLFGAFAAAGARQSALQRNAREIGMLHAVGVDLRSLRAVEMRRALRLTFRAAIVAAPLMILVAAALNASELGVHIGVGITELCVGISLTLAALVLAGHRSLTRFQKTLDLSLAVKG